MSNMTEKEKAKVYDEAIERAKKLRDKIDNKIMEEIFSELKENDDEKIKNAILNYLKKMKENCQDDICGVHIEDAIAWVEKQGDQTSLQINERERLYLVSDMLTWKDGIYQYLDDQRVQEFVKKLCSKYVKSYITPLVISNSSNTGKNKQKSADKVEPKFKIGDWIISSILGTARIIGINNSNEYQLEHINGKQEFLSIDYVNYAYNKWTIKDAKNGDILALSWLEDKNIWEKIIIFKKYHSEGVKGLYSMPCVEGYGNTLKNGKIVFTEKVPYYSKTWTCNLHPATREQRDTLIKVINDAGYEWYAEKKELKKRK